jgi:hypothetical protein
VSTVRGSLRLVEATRKIERELAQHDIESHTVIFLRNDVYELLLEETPDRGKETRANLDWTDSDSLRELLRRRIVFSQGIAPETQFDSLWRAICVPVIEAEESAQYLIDRCLMRPRYLIDLINHCKGFAINVGHERIEVEDVKKGLQAFSTGLVTEIGLELRDVFPHCNDVLYAFIDAPAQEQLIDVKARLVAYGAPGTHVEKLLEILIWFGVVGVVWSDGDVRFIHSVQYDMKLLRNYIRSRPEEEIVLRINPAFWDGLAIRQDAT